MRAVVVGAGAVGARVARQLMSLCDLDELAVIEPDGGRLDAVIESLGPPSRPEKAYPGALEAGEVVVLAAPGGHAEAARTAVERGAHVVSVSDDVSEVRRLLALDGPARDQGIHVVVGAGFSPGLSCVLAAFAGRSFDRVHEIRVAKVGTGGPACARQHHSALRSEIEEWRDGSWQLLKAGSGRELCWFPDPVCGVDCYRGALAEPLLLVPAFEGVDRVTARLGASRRDRLTSRLPMLRRPHPEGGLGAVRVEVRGVLGTVHDDRVLGAIDRPAVAAGVVSAMAARWILDGRLSRTGAAGLASLVEPGPFLADLAERGVKVATFEESKVSSVA